MRVRLIAIAGGWAAVAALATAVSWTGVRLVGAEVSPSGPGTLSQAEVQARIRAAGPLATPAGPGASGTTAPGQAGPGQTGQTGPGAGTASAAAGGRSVVTAGGTVVLSCTGDLINARWSPAQGYVMSTEDGRRDPSAVKVEFSNGTLTSTVRASCRAGTLTVSSQDRVED